MAFIDLVRFHAGLLGDTLTGLIRSAGHPIAEDLVGEQVVGHNLLLAHSEESEQDTSHETGAVLASHAVEQQRLAVRVGGRLEHRPVAVQSVGDGVTEVALEHRRDVDLLWLVAKQQVGGHREPAVLGGIDPLGLLAEQQVGGHRELAVLRRNRHP